MSDLHEPPHKRKRVISSMVRRMEAIDLLNSGVTVAKVAESFGVSRSTISLWKRRQHETRTFCNGLRRVNFSDGRPLDDALYVWYLSTLDKGEYVTAKMIQEKAKEINYSITGDDNFSPGTPWVSQWKRRRGLIGRKVEKPSPESTIPYPLVVDRLHPYDFRNLCNCHRPTVISMSPMMENSASPLKKDSPSMKESDNLNSSNSPHEDVDVVLGDADTDVGAEMEDEEEAVKEVDNMLSGFQPIITNSNDNEHYDNINHRTSPREERLSGKGHPIVTDDDESQETSRLDIGCELDSESNHPLDYRNVDRFSETASPFVPNDVSDTHSENEISETAVDDEKIQEEGNFKRDNINKESEEEVDKTSEEEIVTDSEVSDADENDASVSKISEDRFSESTSPVIGIDRSNEKEVEPEDTNTENNYIYKDVEHMIEEKNNNSIENQISHTYHCSDSIIEINDLSEDEEGIQDMKDKDAVIQDTSHENVLERNEIIILCSSEDESEEDDETNNDDEEKNNNEYSDDDVIYVGRKADEVIEIDSGEE